MLQRYLLTGCVLCLSLLAKGQIPYSYYGPGQGLSDNLVTDIEKDSTGFLWLATANGLNRFDGYTFQTFGPDTAPPGNLSGQYISSIAWTNEHKLLLVYRNNIDFFEIFDPGNFTVKKVNLYPANGVQGNVQVIKTGNKGNIYVLSELINAVHIYQYAPRDTLELVARIPYPGPQIPQIDDFIALPEGSFLVNDLKRGLYRVDADGHLETVMPNNTWPDTIFSPTGLATTVFQNSSRQDKSYIGFEQSPYLFAYDHYSRRLERVPGLDSLPKLELTYLWEDSRGNLLMSLTNGEGTYPLSEHIFFLPTGGSVEDWSFLTQITKYIVNLYSEDFRDILFFGADTGLKIHYNTRFRQENFLSQNLAPDEFGAVMRGIASDADSTIFLTREFSYWYKLNEYSGVLDTIFIRRRPEEEPLDFRCSFDVLFSAPNLLWGIACDGNGNGLLIRYDLDTDMAKVFEYETRFQDLVMAPDGHLWLIANGPSGNSGLVRFDPVSESFQPYITTEGKNPFQRYQLNCLTQDNQGRLWIGTNRGLLRFSFAENQLDIFTRAQQLTSNTIQVLVFDHQDQLWVGTSNGITVLDQEGNYLKRYTTQQGLASNNISSIIPDQHQNTWVSTNSGLSVRTPGSNKFRSYFFTDGFPSDNFINNSGLQSHSGYLYLGTVNGFTRFRPEKLLYQVELPAPQFSLIERYDLEKDSVKKNCSTYCTNDVIQIRPEDDYLDLSFFLPYYQAPKKNTFRIKMTPLETEWNDLGTQNTYRYQRIPPGKYTIHLQGSAPSGQWSPQITTLSVQVLPHWYETLWAYAAMIAVIGILAYLVFQYRLRQKLKVAQLRTKISSDIHDEVSGLLSGIAMQSDLLQESTPDPQQQKRLQKIGEVSRKAVSQIHDVLWSIDSRKDLMDELVNRMREHAEDILPSRGITFDIQQVNLDPRKRLRVTIRQNVFFIYKEAINNVAKHSDATKVIIRLERQKSSLTMRIHDNGTRQPNGSVRPGQGIDNMHMRASRIKGNLTLTFENGCQVKLHLPRF